MSQVKFRAEYKGKPVIVVGGYDRPLSYYHLTIFDMDDDSDQDVVWSCLDGSDPFEVKSVEPLKEVLTKFGIEPPEGFWEQCSRKEGNVFHYWNGEQWISQKPNEPLMP
jgi:hypothetical protein